MLPTKEELIEKISEAFTLAKHINTPFYESCNKQEKEKIIKNYARRTTTYKGAADALQALLSSLPEPIPGYMNKHDMYYRQLLGMKK